MGDEPQNKQTNRKLPISGALFYQGTTSISTQRCIHKTFGEVQSHERKTGHNQNVQDKGSCTETRSLHRWPLYKWSVHNHKSWGPWHRTSHEKVSFRVIYAVWTHFSLQIKIIIVQETEERCTENLSILRKSLEIHAHKNLKMFTSGQWDSWNGRERTKREERELIN